MSTCKPDELKEKLLESIDFLLEDKEKYFNNPETVFSRTQKISFHDTVLFPMIATNDSTYVEMTDFFSDKKLPSQAAMSYRRSQIKPVAFESLLHHFTSLIPKNNKYHDLTVLACDGTRLNTPYNPKDEESFVNCIEGRKGYNQLHLNTCYDLLNECFTDAIVQGYHSMNEIKALCQMMDRYENSQKALFIADRGYFSFNVIAHAKKNDHYFLIRITPRAAESIFSNSKTIVQTEEYVDMEGTIRIGRKNTNERKALKNYHYLHKKANYDYIEPCGPEIDEFQVRLLKFPISDSVSEYILTNLPQKDYTLTDIKALYKIRWKIETSYRYLKYASGLVHMHALRPDFILQEIFAKLTAYNFCSAIMNSIKIKNKNKTKYLYAADKTYGFKMIIRFLKGKTLSLIELIEKKKVPVRPERKFKRNMRSQRADTLNYR